MIVFKKKKGVKKKANKKSALPKRLWTKEIKYDELRRINTSIIYLDSDNKLEPDSYYGDARLRIEVDHLQPYKTMVKLLLSKGQFTGDSYTNTNYVSIRIDNDLVRNYYFTDDLTSHFGSLYLIDKSILPQKFKKAKKIVIEVPIFRYENRQQFIFTLDKPFKELYKEIKL